MRTCCVVVLSVVVLSTSFRADQSPDERAAVRSLIGKRGDAIVTLLGTVKTVMAMGGREITANEERLQTGATLIDASGLAVVSLASLEPGNLVADLMAGQMGSAGMPDMKLDVKSDTTDLRLRLADGRELPAKVVLRDNDLDLAFVKPVEALPAPVAFIDGPSAAPAVADLLVGLQRLGEMAGWKVGAVFSTVVAILDKPRTAYLGSTGLGGAVFDNAGRFVGISVLSRKGRGGSSAMSMTSAFSGMGAMDALGMMPIVLPADEIREIAKQATVK